MKRKNSTLLFLLLALISCFTVRGISTAYSQEKAGNTNAPFRGGDMIVRIPYGSGEGEISGPEYNKNGNKVKESPSCFTVDSSENILLVDVINNRVVRFDSKEKKTSTLFKYEKTDIGNNYVSDIAVSKSGFIYLADAEANKVYKFTYDGKVSGILGQSEKEKIVKKVKHVFTDDSSSVFIIDTLDHKVVVFDDAGKLVKEYRMPISESIFAYAHASDRLGNLYISRLVNNKFQVMQANKSNEVVYTHICSPPIENDRIADCRLIGFDENNDAYVRAVLVDKDGVFKCNYLVKFECKTHLMTKIETPRIPDIKGLTMTKPFLLLKSNVILSYKDDGKGISIVSFEIK